MKIKATEGQTSNTQMKEGQASIEQIAMWKNLHGKIFAFEVEDSIAYLKKPHRNVLDAAHSFSQNDPLKFADVMLENCWLGGDDTIKTDAAKFLCVSQKLDQLLQVSDASLKEL